MTLPLYLVEAVITKPFRTQLKSYIRGNSLQDVVSRMNDEFPSALLTSAREIDD